RPPWPRGSPPAPAPRAGAPPQPASPDPPPPPPSDPHPPRRARQRKPERSVAFDVHRHSSRPDVGPRLPRRHAPARPFMNEWAVAGRSVAAAARRRSSRGVLLRSSPPPGGGPAAGAHTRTEVSL